MLLAAICLTALFYDVSARNKKLLVSSSDVVDDLYSGCRQQAMKRFILSDLLKQELNVSAAFSHSWVSNSKCAALIPGGKQAHTTALSAYAFGDPEFLETFDNAVETMGVNVSTYENRFHFKALHFLLMDAMTLLKPTKCQTVFFLYEDSYIPKKGSIVRFGSFTLALSTFQTLKKLEDLEGLVVLNITSCFFVNVEEYICMKEREQVLLSPAEEFMVETVNKIDDDDTQYTEIVLKSSQLNSTHNCYAFSRSPAPVSTLGIMSVLVILSFLCSSV